MSVDKLTHPNVVVREIAIRDLIANGTAESRTILAAHFKKETELKLKYLIKEFLVSASGQKSTAVTSQKKDSAVGERLLKALRSSDIYVLRKAFAFAVDNRILAALPEMEKACHHHPDNLLKSYILRLQAYRGAVAIPFILNYAHETDEEVAELIIQLLDSMHNTAALAAICSLLFTGSSQIKKIAGQCLKNTERDKIDYVLCKMEASEHEGYRQTAVKVKEYLAWSEEKSADGETAIAIIQRQLAETKEPKVIATAIFAIFGTDETAEVKRAIIQPFISHTDDRVRANAVEVLSHLLLEEEKHLFADFLTDSNNRVLANAIIALSSSSLLYDKYSADILQAMERLFTLHGEDGIFSALYCIGILEKDEFLPLLNNLLLNCVGKIRTRALQVLESWSVASPSAAQLLQKLRSSDEVDFSEASLTVADFSVTDSSATDSSAANPAVVATSSAKNSAFVTTKKTIIPKTKTNIPQFTVFSLCWLLLAVLLSALNSFIYGYLGIQLLSWFLSALLFMVVALVFLASLYPCREFFAHWAFLWRFFLAFFFGVTFSLFAWQGWGVGATIPMPVWEAFFTTVRLGYWKGSQPGAVFLLTLAVMELLFFSFLAFVMLSKWLSFEKRKIS